MTTRTDELWNLTIAFRAAGIETSRLDAELLLMHVLGIDRTQLLLTLEDVLTPEQSTYLTNLANRRLDREPIAYLTGSREFMGLDLIVDSRVLIPRPETETLVEWALDWLSYRPNARVIDVGTGSGAIAIAIAVHGPPLTEITAVDISAGTLEVAERNAAQHVQNRVELRLSDLLESVDSRYDLILANLPYLTPEQIAGSPTIAFEPVLALDGGENGSQLIERLISQLPAHLAEGGAVGLELDPGHADAMAQHLAIALPQHSIEIRPDLAGFPRFLFATSRI
jgi:release factor glutamine methyltransferase